MKSISMDREITKEIKKTRVRRLAIEHLHDLFHRMAKICPDVVLLSFEVTI